MKKTFTLLNLIAVIQVFYLSTCVGQTANWKTHEETVDNKFTVQFQHPSNTVLEHIQNGLCVGDNTLKSGDKSEFIVSQDWCIWMEDASQHAMESEIDYFKQNCPSDRRLEIETTTIDGQEATVLKEIDVNSNKPVKIRVYVTRFETLFSIYLDSDKVEQFEQFLKTIKISEKK